MIGALAIGPGDSVHIFDPSSGRLTVLDPQLKLARMASPVPVSPGIELLVLEDGGYVTAREIGAPDRAGLPLHQLDSNGRLTRSFGSRTRAFGPDPRHSIRRALASGGDGIFWSGHRFRYELTAWDSTNTQLARIERSPEWFPIPEPARQSDADKPPAPYLNAVWQSRAGNLLVAVHVADPEWRTGVDPASDPGHRRILSDVDYLDTIIEMLDPSGRPLGRVRVDGVVTGFLPGERVAILIEDAAGYPYLSIQSIRRSRE